MITLSLFILAVTEIVEKTFNMNTQHISKQLCLSVD